MELPGSEIRPRVERRSSLLDMVWPPCTARCGSSFQPATAAVTPAVPRGMCSSSEQVTPHLTLARHADRIAGAAHCRVLPASYYACSSSPHTAKLCARFIQLKRECRHSCCVCRGSQRSPSTLCLRGGVRCAHVEACLQQADRTAPERRQDPLRHRRLASRQGGAARIRLDTLAAARP